MECKVTAIDVEVKCPVDMSWDARDALSASISHAVGNEVYRIAEWILSNLAWNVVVYVYPCERGSEENLIWITKRRAFSIRRESRRTMWHERRIFITK